MSRTEAYRRMAAAAREVEQGMDALREAGLALNPPETLVGGIRNLAQAFFSERDNARLLEERLRLRVRPWVEGTWPARCLQRAFVEGAKWWEWTVTGATMWQSDQSKAAEEAARSFGEKADDVEKLRALLVAVVEAQPWALDRLGRLDEAQEALGMAPENRWRRLEGGDLIRPLGAAMERASPGGPE